MKKLFITILTALLPLLASADDSGSCGENLTYNYVEATQTLTISGTGDMGMDNFFSSMPWSSYKSNIIKVVINSGVTSIGSNAFAGCSSLLSISIPDGVTRIGDYAFDECANLLSISLPESVISIGKSAFKNCDNLKSVNIPKGVTSIENNTFSMCRSLLTIEIPEMVTSIGSYAFEYCKSIKELIIPARVKTIGIAAFVWCEGLKSIKIPEGVTSIGESAFFGCGALKSISLPKSLTIIESGTFGNCGNLNYISLPEGLKNIKSGAFSGCSIENILIPSSVEFIYAEAFSGCSGLKEVKALPKNPPFLFENAFSNYNNITLKMPKESQEAYMTTSPWDKFGSYQTLTGDDIVKKKCSKPTITLENGTLHFACETADVIYKYDIVGLSSGEGNDVSLTSIKVSVYAMKSGYEDSDAATMEIAIGGIQGDVDGDGKVNVADHVKLSDIIMNMNQ